VSCLLKSIDDWYSPFDDLRKVFDNVIIHFFVESLRGMGSEMINCVGLCLILKVESNFVELMVSGVLFSYVLLFIYNFSCLFKVFVVGNSRKSP